MFKTFILIVLIFSTSCSISTVQENKTTVSTTPKRELKKEIPNASWVKNYFEGFETRGFAFEKGKGFKNPKIHIEKHSGLDETAAKNGYSILRETLLPENDLEVRIWVGFGKYGNDGLILKRNAGNWSAINLRGMLCHLEEPKKYNLQSPKFGWETTWKKLVDAEILTLPDSSKLKYENTVEDGKSYVVETNFEDVYRTYHYGNPKYAKVKEAEPIIKIGQIILDEFGLESFSTETDGCKINE